MKNSNASENVPSRSDTEEELNSEQASIRLIKLIPTLVGWPARLGSSTGLHGKTADFVRLVHPVLNSVASMCETSGLDWQHTEAVSAFASVVGVLNSIEALDHQEGEHYTEFPTPRDAETERGLRRRRKQLAKRTVIATNDLADRVRHLAAALSGPGDAPLNEQRHDTVSRGPSQASDAEVQPRKRPLSLAWPSNSTAGGKVLRALSNAAPDVFLAEASLGSGNARDTVSRLRRAGWPIESARAARTRRDDIPADAKGYRFIPEERSRLSPEGLSK